MANQLELDRLRQTCSARLQQFITSAHETEFSMYKLSMPVSVGAVRQYASHRSAEAVAFENYISASMRLSDFLDQHSYNIN